MYMNVMYVFKKKLFTFLGLRTTAPQTVPTEPFFFSLNLLDQNVYLVHKYRVGLIMDV